MIPTARALGASVLFVALTLYTASSEVPWLFLLALWLGAIVPASFAYAMWNRGGLTLGLAVRETRPAPDSPVEALPDAVARRSPWQTPVFEGDGIGLEIAFRSRRGSRGPVWAAGAVGGGQFRAGTGLVTEAGWSRLTWLPAERRGVVRAAGWSMGTSDPLGLFRGRRQLPDADVATVLPKFASLAAHRRSREVEASVPVQRAGSGNELFGIREFRHGDSLRRIHWRSSARHGSLVVREYEPPGAQTISIVIDPHPGPADTADQLARIAASEAWDCIREGGHVLLPGEAATTDIWEVLQWLARYPAGSVSPVQRVANTVVVTADPGLLRPDAIRNWLVGDARVRTDVDFERVGTAWPL